MMAKESSVMVIIPRGPFVSNGLFHDANPRNLPFLEPRNYQCYRVLNIKVIQMNNIIYTFLYCDSKVFAPNEGINPPKWQLVRLEMCKSVWLSLCEEMQIN